MCDFGLGDNIINDAAREKMLRWHGFLVDTVDRSVYTILLQRIGSPLRQSIIVKTKDGMVGDSGKPLKSGSICYE